MPQENPTVLSCRWMSNVGLDHTKTSRLGTLSVHKGCQNRVLEQWALKLQNFIFSQFYRLKFKIEVLEGLASGEPFLPGIQTAFILSGSSHCLLSVPMLSWFLFLLYGHQSYWVRSLPLWPHLILIISLQAHLQKQSLWVLGLNIRIWRQTQFSP